MSDDENTVEETTTEETVEETPAEVVAEPEPVAETTTTGDKVTKVSIGTGKEVFSGACALCGARIASGIVKDGKVNCPTCKGDF